MLLWFKALHVIFMVTWFAGLFYLPRLFVYNAMSTDENTKAQLNIMQGKLFVIMSIGALLTLVFGMLTLVQAVSIYMSGSWMLVKLVFVAILMAYHFMCAKMVVSFSRGTNTRSHKWYRWFNEVPVIGLVVIVILVIVKPF